jgi:hypothetical protein
LLDGSCIAAQTYYPDVDGDSFGDPDLPLDAFNIPVGYVLDKTDCDDLNNQMYPGVQGTGANMNNKCNGVFEGDESGGASMGDFNLDHTVNSTDLLIFLGAFGCTSDCSGD